MTTLLCVTGMLFFLVTGFLWALRVDDSLILYLHFDEGKGEVVKDLSQYGNDGALIGEPKWVEGKFEGALWFDGVDDHVLVPHTEILCVTEAVTVMAWINTERYGGPGGVNWQGIVAKGNNPRSYSLYTRINEVLHFSTGPGGAFVGTQSGKTFPLDEWVHVVAMVKEGKHIYYINGEFATEAGNGAVLPGLADTSTVFVARTADCHLRSETRL